MKQGAISVLAAATGLICLMTAAGCGGASSDGPPTKEAFVRQANTTCDKGTGERDKKIAVVAASGKVLNRTEQEELVLETLPSYEAEADRLADLRPPAGEEEKVEEIVNALRAGVQRVKADPGTATVSSIPFKKANELAEAYGLKRCRF